MSLIVAKHVPRISEIQHILNQSFQRSTDPKAFRILYALQVVSMQEDELCIHLLTKAMSRRLRAAAIRLVTLTATSLFMLAVWAV